MNCQARSSPYIFRIGYYPPPRAVGHGPAWRPQIPHDAPTDLNHFLDGAPKTPCVVFFLAYMVPRPLALGVNFPFRKLCCGSRTWCSQAYHPDPCVHTHRPGGLGSIHHVRAHIGIFMRTYLCNNSLAVEVASPLLTIFPNTIRMLWVQIPLN